MNERNMSGNSNITPPDYNVFLTEIGETMDGPEGRERATNKTYTYLSGSDFIKDSAQRYYRIMPRLAWGISFFFGVLAGIHGYALEVGYGFLFLVSSVAFPFFILGAINQKIYILLAQAEARIVTKDLVETEQSHFRTLMRMTKEGIDPRPEELPIRPEVRKMFKEWFTGRNSANPNEKVSAMMTEALVTAMGSATVDERKIDAVTNDSESSEDLPKPFMIPGFGAGGKA